jgi:hypothetical protein
MEDEEKQIIRDELSQDYLNVAKGLPFLFQNIDSFVTLSRDNTTITEVELYPFDSDAGNYEFWEKVGQMLGNLMELQTLNLNFLPCREFNDNGDETRRRVPDWEILTRILPYYRNKVFLSSSTRDDDVEFEDVQALARAIHGHPMISGFIAQFGFTFANIGTWCSALATLPCLKRVEFGLQDPETEDQRVLGNAEPLTELLRAPALQSVRFDGFYFTNALCHAAANALEEGSSIIEIGL